MSHTNGTTPHAPLGPFRSYYCQECGLFLFETNIPLGTPGQVRLTCPDRRHSPRVVQAPYAGDTPKPKPDRSDWVRRQQPRAVSMDRLT